MTKEKLNEILQKHKLWLEDKDGGEKADLSSANLSSADLSSANLSCADLRFANLSSADLSSANLRYADLSSADLRFANLSCANLSSADLSCANLSSANLSSADLSSANLSSADLRFADLLYFTFNRDTAYYQFDGMIRVGCEYKTVDEWLESYKKIGKKYSYTDLEIEVYGNFILTCSMLEESREKKDD